MSPLPRPEFFGRDLDEAGNVELQRAARADLLKAVENIRQYALSKQSQVLLKFVEHATTAIEVIDWSIPFRRG